MGFPAFATLDVGILKMEKSRKAYLCGEESCPWPGHRKSELVFVAFFREMKIGQKMLTGLKSGIIRPPLSPDRVRGFMAAEVGLCHTQD
jgi:hypothetical protein